MKRSASFLTLRKRNPKITISFYFTACITLLLILGKSYKSAALSLLVHEGGHLICMFLLSLPPKEIRLHLFGIDIVRDKNAGYLSDAAISFAGPLANIIFSLFGFPESLILGIVHLLPIISLDGGRVLFSLLALFLSHKTADGIVLVLSYVIILPLAFLGFNLLLSSGNNFTLLLLCVYLLLSLIFRQENDY